MTVDQRFTDSMLDHRPSERQLRVFRGINAV
jgi:hypothetical protein